MRKSASANRRHALTGGLSPIFTSVAGSSALWSITSMREQIAAPSMISRSSAVLGRCMPVPMMIIIRLSLTPAELSTSSIAGMNCLFGTGRVMSEMVMATVCGLLALTSSASGAEPIGAVSAVLTAESGLSIADTCWPSSTVALAGTFSAMPDLPYRSFTVLVAVIILPVST